MMASIVARVLLLSLLPLLFSLPCRAQPGKSFVTFSLSFIDRITREIFEPYVYLVCGNK
jgi:hypothetical protein